MANDSIATAQANTVLGRVVFMQSPEILNGRALAEKLRVTELGEAGPRRFPGTAATNNYCCS
jgi:hypothetical protein